jgi:excinuclease ABC subunit C
MPAWPDLLLIDGGLGQLNAVMTILRNSASQAVDHRRRRQGRRPRSRARAVLHSRQAGFHAAAARSGALFHPAARDEAHRFAIGSHRARRKKDMVKNPLDEIAGIGPTRKRALLHHFGTAKGVSRARSTIWRRSKAFHEAMARQIYDHFHQVGLIVRRDNTRHLTAAVDLFRCFSHPIWPIARA